MSAQMKKPHTDDLIELIYHGDSIIKFLVPRKALDQLKPYRIIIDEEESIPADVVFEKLYKKYGRVGAFIRGCRARDDMTQAELAKKLGITVKEVRLIEYSKIEIDKKLAQKLAKIFNTNERLFLKKS